MIKSEQLKPAFDEMLKCGLSKEKAHQEIAFALMQINAKESLWKSPLLGLNNAVSQVAYTGLSLNHLKQEAVISDYNEKGQRGVFFMPMYRGLLKVAKSEGAIIADNTQVINKGDDYEINAAAFKNPVRHIIKATGKDRVAELTYCILLLPSGIESVTLFYEDEYQTLKNNAKNKRADSPHSVWSDEMRKKSALKRALKTVSGDRDSKLEHLIALDNVQYSNDPLTPKEKPTEPDVKKKPALTKQHKKWNGAIQALKAKTQSIESIKEYFELTPANEKLLCELSK